MILYFSATGNCKYVAERIAAEFDDTAVSIEVSNGQVNLSENEMLGIVTPVYNWELPITTREFLQNLQVIRASASHVSKSGVRLFPYYLLTYIMPPLYKP